MESKLELRQCKECGAQLKGRSDQVYCSDPCRTSANNRIKSEHLANSLASVKAVNYILRNNHKILSDLSKKGVEFTLIYLRDRGFSFRYLTHVEQKEDVLINYCYDFGYIIQQDTIRLLT